ncbi:MAG: hypothetical protein ACETVP_01470 [Candidatus Bathyarchaeia archaeon]|jgi:C4-type Zn-finger protein
MGILKNFRDVLKSTKRRSPTLKLCPRCESPKLRLSSRFDVWLTPEQYICENCGYKGPIVMELEEKKENTSPAT